jgi:translation elongation factor EF-Ts
MVVDPREIVAIETMMLAIDAALTEISGDTTSAYIWTREDGIDSATLRKGKRH